MAELTDPLADRRQRALEAAHDEIGPTNVIRADAIRAIDQAIETATRVKITEDIIDAAYGEVPWEATERGDVHDIVKAAFRAAGFEVEE